MLIEESDLLPIFPLSASAALGPKAVRVGFTQLRSRIGSPSVTCGHQLGETSTGRRGGSLNCRTPDRRGEATRTCVPRNLATNRWPPAGGYPCQVLDTAEATPGRPTKRRIRAAGRAIEAAALMCAAAVAQRWIPMPRWSGVLGEAGTVPPEWAGRSPTGVATSAGTLTELRVAIAVDRACRMLPFNPTCLAQATAGQVMLRRRGEPGAVVIGLRPMASPTEYSRPNSRGTSDWKAHAWLMGSSGALTGGPAAAGFTASTAFRPSSWGTGADGGGPEPR
jgi:hypothetical protein